MGALFVVPRQAGTDTSTTGHNPHPYNYMLTSKFVIYCNAEIKSNAYTSLSTNL